MSERDIDALKQGNMNLSRFKNKKSKNSKPKTKIQYSSLECVLGSKTKIRILSILNEGNQNISSIVSKARSNNAVITQHTNDLITHDLIKLNKFGEKIKIFSLNRDSLNVRNIVTLINQWEGQ